MTNRTYFGRFSIGQTIKTRKYGILVITDICKACRLVWANNEKFNFLFKVTTDGRIIQEHWREHKKDTDE